MKQKAITWITSFSALTALLWAAGLGLVVKDQWLNTPDSLIKKDISEAPTPTHGLKNDSVIHVMALGDSLTRGTGDDNGKGYVGYLIESIKKKTKRPVLVTNSAIQGERSYGLASQLQQPEIQRQIAAANVIVMTIGGNDLFNGGESLQSLNLTAIRSAKENYLKNLARIYREIRTLNPTAEIYHVGLYNPFIHFKDTKTTSSIVREWNFDSADLTGQFQNIVYVPTFDLFQLHVENYLYSDQFHPNQKGYQLIAERVASLITFKEEIKK